VDEETTALLRKALKTHAWYFSQKAEPTGFYRTIGRIDEKLGELNANIRAASESSGRLAGALNAITVVGVVIAVCQFGLQIAGFFLK